MIGVESRYSKRIGGFDRLNWAVTFFVIALVAAILGFTGVAVAAAGIAKLICDGFAHGSEVAGEIFSKQEGLSFVQFKGGPRANAVNSRC